jgi:hypothetical protein
MKNWPLFGFALAAVVLSFALWAGWIVWQSARLETPVPWFKPMTCMTYVDRYGDETSSCVTADWAGYVPMDAVGFRIYVIRYARP